MKNFIKNHVGSLIAWLAILIIAVVTLPNVNALTRAHSDITLPKNVESSIATNIQNKWGHNQDNTYEAGIVFNKKNGKLTSEDKSEINNTIQYLQDNKKSLGIKSMMTPNDNEAAKKQLISKDKTTEIVQLNIDKNHSTVSATNKALIKAAKTKGLRTYVTGVKILEDSFSEEVQEGIKKTEAITVIFIFIVLVLVFRSPIVPLISLLTVGISFLVSFSLVTNLVEHANFPFSNFTQVFMVIVLFGIGTDYNILLYDKFKENLGADMGRYEAAKDARKKAGRTILFSGSSILIGFTALGLAKFSIYKSAVGVAVGVAVLLLVLLTLNPFFMATLGEKMFWPVKEFNGKSSSKLWGWLSKSTLKYPLIFLAVAAIITVPIMLQYSNHLNYDDADELRDSEPAKAGLLVIQDHFTKGTAEYSTLYIKNNKKLDNEKYLKEIDALTKKIKKDKDVSSVMSITQPAGKKVSDLYLYNQLKTVNSGLSSAKKGLNKLSKGSEQLTTGLGQLSDGTEQLSSGLSTMNDQLSEQMSGSSSQLAQLQSGLPQINNGIQQINSGLQNAQMPNTASIAGNLNNVGTQAQNIGNNLTSAGNNLRNIQAASSSSNMDTTQIMSQYQNAASQARLTTAQQAAMGKVMQQTLQGVKSKVNSQQIAAGRQLQQVANNLQAAGLADRSLAGSMTSVASSMQGLQSSMGQLSTLRSSVNELATASNVALPGAASAITQLQGGLTQVQSAIGQAMPAADKLNSGAKQLYSQAPELTKGMNKVNKGLGKIEDYTNPLSKSAAADTFYIPTQVLKSATFKPAIDNYLSQDKKATKIMIIFKGNPSSLKMAKKANEINKMAKMSLQGTNLDKATVAMGGQSEKIYDTQSIASQDFLRTATIMLVGIGIALIIITRSVLQPVFILGTLLIAYFTSLSITELVVKDIMHRSMLTWNTPFFSFIMLVALGVDYSIFLMMRYREEGIEDSNMTASERILKACIAIGVVVISAAIILGGTFAALMPSGVPTLIEVALAVIFGLLLLIFLIPINMSAAMKITYEGLNFNWLKKKSTSK
ncbi:RND superfamily putative drug exporter [Lactobacillus colini]|uniref:RND superfamily putative drug exporter n=1 Tax=Lactobacillus colini TaxID=1819254 RepID=A0ABS4MEF6_9LACO|nr:MMPL family transporter [Lactobacillus colini]MBP2058046.1 RND superfamily putative drug exporter [Lactobacillus colini]